MADREVKPHVLLDYLIAKKWAENDKDIAKLLNTTPPVISRVRNGTRGVTARLVLSIYDKTELTIEQIRGLIRGKKP